MSRAFVADASTLIYLGALGLYERIGFLGPLGVPPAVWSEVVTAGIKIGAPDVEATIAAEASGLLRRTALDRTQVAQASAYRQQFGIGRGESEVLAALSTSGTGILDDRRALRVASNLGLRTVSTLRISMIGLELGALTSDEAGDLLNQLSRVSKPSASRLLMLQAQIREKNI